MASSLTDTSARFNDHLKGLQEEFELQSKATSTNSSRPSRFNVYLRRLKAEFEHMAEELQNDREEYEAIIEAQTKELEDVRRNFVCGRCGEGPLSARTTLDKPTTSDRSTQLSTASRSTGTSYTKSQPVATRANLPSPLSQASPSHSIFHTITVHTLSHQRSIWCVKFSRDGKYVAAGCLDGKAYIYDVQTGNLTCTLSATKGFFSSLCFNHDGQYLATAGSSDFCIYIWEINTDALRRTFKGHTKFIDSVDFSPNGRLLVSASSDNTVRLWDNGLAKILTDDDPELSGYYNSAVFSSDGRCIAASDCGGMVKIWGVHTGQLVGKVKVTSANSVRFMPDGKELVTGGENDTTLRLWDVRALLRTDSWDRVTKPKQEFSGHKAPVSSLAISSDGRWVVSGSYDQSVRVWDTRNAAEKCILAHDSHVHAVDFSPAGDYFASGEFNGTVVIWRYSYTSPGASVQDGSDLLP